MALRNHLSWFTAVLFSSVPGRAVHYLGVVATVLLLQFHSWSFLVVFRLRLFNRVRLISASLTSVFSCLEQGIVAPLSCPTAPLHTKLSLPTLDPTRSLSSGCIASRNRWNVAPPPTFPCTCLAILWTSMAVSPVRCTRPLRVCDLLSHCFQYQFVCVDRTTCSCMSVGDTGPSSVLSLHCVP